jgi:hypothetical protein
MRAPDTWLITNSENMPMFAPMSTTVAPSAKVTPWRR